MRFQQVLLQFLLLLVLGAAWAPRAAGPSIAVSFAAAGNDCDFTTTAFTPFTCYVLVLLGGDPAVAGITGAEFQLTGLADPSLVATVTPNPAANLSLGNPLAGGCNIAFPGCQTGPVVLLYTLSVLPVGPVAGRDLRIAQRATPSNPAFSCPLVTLCDAPAFTKICVCNCDAQLNLPGSCTACFHPCAVGVERLNWSAIKRMYQD